MNLFELSPTTRWAIGSTNVRTTATIKSDKHTFELVIRANKSVADHLSGWLDKVLDREDDWDEGRYVELTCKENRETLDGVEPVIDTIAKAIIKQISDQELKYVYLFSTTLHRREIFEKLAKAVAKKKEWSVYRDKNYFLIHKTTLAIHQPD
jgi:hypothetical protein